MSQSISPNMCPFCLHFPSVQKRMSGKYVVSCDYINCACMPKTWEADTRGEAIEMWNCGIDIKKIIKRKRMKKCNWFVVGMDYIYGGYHGMYTCGYLMNATYKEAMDYGVDLSYAVMESYSCIADNLEYEYDNDGETVRKSDEDIEDAYAENVEFIVAPFREDLSVEYINNENYECK